MLPGSILIGALLLAPTLTLVAQDTAKPADTFPKIRLTGQIRERSEIDGRSFADIPSPEVIHYLRTRLGAVASIAADVSVTVELQDARLFGEHGTTQNIGAPALDVRQAMFDFRRIGGAPIGVRLGRQAFGYANERLIGRVDWINMAPSYDGIVATIGEPDLSVDLLGVAIARRPNGTGFDRDVFLAGAWGAWKPKEGPVSVHAFYLFDNPHQDTITIFRHTPGIYSAGSFGGFDYEIDAALQFGEFRIALAEEGDSLNPIPARVITRDISASLIGLRAGYTFEDLMGLRIGAGFDLLSGSDPAKPETYGAFNTLYATNHKFYGFMDYFTNIPLHTRNQGLRDIIGQLSVVLSKQFRAAADFHVFAHAIDAIPIGQELDLTLTYRPVAPLTITGGFSAFFADETRLVLRGLRNSTSWAYLMLAAGF